MGIVLKNNYALGIGLNYAQGIVPNYAQDIVPLDMLETNSGIMSSLLTNHMTRFYRSASGINRL